VPGPRPRRRRRKRRRRPPCGLSSPSENGPAAGAAGGCGRRSRGGCEARCGGCCAGRPVAGGVSRWPSRLPRSPRPLRRFFSRRGSGVSVHPSSRCRNVTTISGRPARERKKSTILARNVAKGSPVNAGIRSASKSTMRVQQTRFVRPSGASSTITKRSRSWSRVCSRYPNSGNASRHIVFKSSRFFSPPSSVCSIETTRSRNILVCGTSLAGALRVES